MSASASTPAARPRIDPRIRARRIAVQRDEGRRRLRRLTIGAGVVAVGASAWGITRTPMLDVDHIRVSGAGRSGAGAVATATGIDRGDALLTVDLGVAARRISALPWVQTVEVRRAWPGTVRVEVVERTAAAAVPVQGGGWVLLDTTGRQLATVADVEAGIVRIELAPVTPLLGAQLGAGTGAILEFAATIPGALRDRLTSLEPAAGGAVDATVVLRDGEPATVLLGRPTETAAKWLALLSVLEDTDPRGLDRIDVRVPSAPALTRR